MLNALRTNRNRLFPAFAFLFAAAGLPAAVHVVPPSGGDDTAALQSALNLCVAEPDCVVELQPGVYSTTQIVVTGFRGWIRGAGIGQTIVRPFGVLKVNGPTAWRATPQTLPSALNPWPVLWSFIDGETRISGVTLRADRFPATDPYSNFPTFPAPNTATHLLALVLVTSSGDGIKASSHFDHTSFEGAAGNFPEGWANSFNLHWGIVHWLRGLGVFMGGDHSIKASVFRGAIGAHTIQGTAEGRVVFGGSPQDGNLYDGTCYPIEMFDISKSTVEISHNRFLGCQREPLNQSGRSRGVWLGQSDPLDQPSSFLIDHNYFAWDLGYAIGLQDRIKPPSAQVAVTANHIESLRAAGGVQVANFSGGVLPVQLTAGLIANNRMTGTALGTLRRFAAIDGGSALVFMGNNVQNFETGPVGGPPPAPYLLSNSLACTVIGAAGTVQILGTGADSHILVGVNRINDNSPGDEISAGSDTRHNVRDAVNQ